MDKVDDTHPSYFFHYFGHFPSQRQENSVNLQDKGGLNYMILTILTAEMASCSKPASIQPKMDFIDGGN